MREDTMTRDHPAATTSRQIPEDLRMYHYRHGYVVAVCENRASAQRATQGLADTGFQREELVLVSHDVDSLESCWDGEDSLEVADPASLAVQTVEVGSGLTLMFAGALAGATIAYFLALGHLGAWPWVVSGGLVGGALGWILGRVGYLRLGRRPARFYDTALRGEQILVGIGLANAKDDEARARARGALERLGLQPIELSQ